MKWNLIADTDKEVILGVLNGTHWLDLPKDSRVVDIKPLGQYDIFQVSLEGEGDRPPSNGKFTLTRLTSTVI